MNDNNNIKSNYICEQKRMSQSQFVKSTASTMQKVAQLPRYHHPGDLINMPTRPIAQQKLEMDGKLQFGSKKYPSLAHEKLVQNLIKTRTSFTTQSIANRLTIAAQQHNLWNQYLKELAANLPQNERIQGQKLQKVYESYLIAKERNHEQMNLSKTVKLFYHLAKGYRFDLRLHPLVMFRMIYPHLGYLNNFTQTRLPFEQYIAFLEEMIAISLIWDQGSTLHGSQLLSFAFWKLQTPEPTMKVSNFSQFLGKFKFSTNEQNFEKDFDYSLREGEIQKDGIVRFECWRKIYLDRGL